MTVTDIDPLADDALRRWASDWADAYDQGHTGAELEKLVGKKVVLAKPATEEDGPKGATGIVVGITFDTLFFSEDEDADTEPLKVLRWGLVFSHGAAVHLFSGMTITEVEE